jgi:hypothetical protein
MLDPQGAIQSEPALVLELMLELLALLALLATSSLVMLKVRTLFCQVIEMSSHLLEKLRRVARSESTVLPHVLLYLRQGQRSMSLGAEVQ